MDGVLIHVLWLMIAAGGVVVTAASLLSGRAWMLRICDFPRLQVLAVLLVAAAYPAVYEAVTGAWPFGRLGVPVFALIIAAALVQVYWAMHFTPLREPEVASAPAQRGASAGTVVRLIMCNVDVENQDRRGALAALLRRRPDVVALVEPDEQWKPLFDELRSVYPYQGGQIRPHGRGVWLLSRLPLGSIDVHHLVEEDRPSIWTTLRDDEGTATAHLVVLHPSPPGLPKRMSDGRYSSRPRDIELLLVADRIARDGDLPWLVTGDFNDVGWSQTTEGFKRTSGLVDPRIGRGTYPTFPASTRFMRYPIDHIMVSPSVRLLGLERLEDVGSDHLPLVATVELPLSAGEGACEVDALARAVGG